MIGETETEVKEKPLLPKTVAGATMLAVPLTAVMGGFGWVVQKMVALDELVAAHEVRIDSHGAAFREIAEGAVEIEKKLARIEAVLEVVKEEQNKRSPYFRKELGP